MYAETTVMIPYGTKMPVRTRPRPCKIRYITNANPNPSTNSTDTLTTVIISVVLKSVHHTGSVNTVA